MTEQDRAKALEALNRNEPNIIDHDYVAILKALTAQQPTVIAPLSPEKMAELRESLSRPDGMIALNGNAPTDAEVRDE